MKIILFVLFFLNLLFMPKSLSTDKEHTSSKLVNDSAIIEIINPRDSIIILTGKLTEAFHEISNLRDSIASINENLTKGLEEIIGYKDSIVTINKRLYKEFFEKAKESSSVDGPLSFIPLVSLVITILLAMISGMFAYITHLANRDRVKTKEVLKELENRFEKIDRRQKIVLEDMDHYLDSILITFNKLLPPDKSVNIELLKYVLYLRHYEKRERFIAINFLREKGDETVIPYLQWVVEKDKQLAVDASVAIEDIKKRIHQS